MCLQFILLMSLISAESIIIEIMKQKYAYEDERQYF